MTLLRLSPLALSRSRFALSPLAELLGAVRILTRSRPDPWLVRWHAAHRAALRARLDADPFASGLIGVLTATSWLPAFVTLPPPDGMRTTLAQELERLRRFGDPVVHAELARSARHADELHAGAGLGWLAGHDWAARTADLFDGLWRDHVQPDWRRRRALLERDVTFRAGLVAVSGWSSALRTMTRRSAWVEPDAIRFSDNPLPDHVVGDDGMLFVPVSAPRGTWLCEEPPHGYALVYPARGLAGPDTGRQAGLGTGQHATPEAAPLSGPVAATAVARLIGGVRARILVELGAGSTTSELAALFGLSVGTVGDHLRILHDAGLAERARAGRRVVYRRTDLGDQLVSAGKGTRGIRDGATDRRRRRPGQR